jgi:endonuclease/exonuclease/phosphatase family metal-dependent hydrolase
VPFPCGSGAAATNRARSLRYRSLLAVEAVLVALVPPGVAVAGGGAPISVMTQNLYLGTGLSDAFAASSWSDLAAAGTHDWATVLANDFGTRAAVLADDIVRGRPDVVALQEVTLWRDQVPGDDLAHSAPDATHVAFDHLAILQAALRFRGVPYTAVVTSTGADVEFPRREPDGGLADLRLTDRDALLVRSDVATRAGNPMHGHYTAQLSDPFLSGPVRSTRSWTSIDYRPDPTTTVRIVNTHLEVGGPRSDTIQARQADELLAVIGRSPYPVIALGDFNAPAGGSVTYRHLTAALHDAWTSVRPGDPGWTCCHDPALADPVGRENARIDLVLTSGNWPVSQVTRTGEQPFRAAPPPLWDSDHLGVTARIVVPGP